MRSLRFATSVLLVALVTGLAHADVTGRWAASGPLGNPSFIDLVQTGRTLVMTVPIELTGQVSSGGGFSVSASMPGFQAGIGGRFLVDETYFVANVASGSSGGIVFGSLEGIRCECFDGNAVAGDGCDPRCQIEPCFTCTAGVPSVCTPSADGAVCNDRNTCTSGETCTAGACGGGAAVVPCVDLTGSWFVVESSVETPRQTTFRTTIRQRGGALEFGGTPVVVPNVVGAIDPLTGVFSSWRAVPSFGCGLETRNGTVAPGGNSYVATGAARTPEADYCLSDLVAVTAWRCGSGTTDPGEQCDDGNGASGDGCSDTCQRESCTGQPDGTSCDAGIPCTAGGSCQGGACTGGVLLAEGTPCNDGVACTVGDTCDIFGQCVPGAQSCPVCQQCSAASGCIPSTGGACDDGNPCTDNDTCRAGACAGTARPAGTPCDDGAACTNGDACDGAGQCAPGASTCGPCETCSPSGCVPADGTSCDDGNVCTAGDACRAGACAGTPAAGTPCDDASACTRDDACSDAGVCSGTSTCGPCQRCAASGCVAAMAASCTAGDPGAVSFALADRREPALDFRWKRAAGPAIDFGRPDLEDDYTLCVFDTSAPEPVLLFRAGAPGGAGCPVQPCWDRRPRGGFRFRSPQGAPDGLGSLVLTKRRNGQVEVQARGKSALLAGRPFGLPVTPAPVPLAVQVVAESGACVEGRFQATAVRVNKPGKLKVRAR